MQLTVVWHKLFWPSSKSPTGFAAHGGLGRQIEALAELFDSTRIVGACAESGNRPGERALAGHNVTVIALSALPRSSLLTWLVLPFWLLRNGSVLAREIAEADAVYPALPSPVGLLGLLLPSSCGSGFSFDRRTIGRSQDSSGASSAHIWSGSPGDGLS